MSAMKGPVRAALAPGDFAVVGRIVSAMSSRRATSRGANWPTWRYAPGWGWDGAACARSAAWSTRAPPTSAMPPRKPTTRAIASRRPISSNASRCSSFNPSRYSLMDIGRRSEVAALQLVDREARGAGGERHVGERGVHAGRAGHARPVGDEDVRGVPHLVVAVEHRRLRVAAHARRAHLVDAHAGEVLVLVRVHVRGAHGLEHLGHVVHHVLAHTAL